MLTYLAHWIYYIPVKQLVCRYTEEGEVNSSSIWEANEENFNNNNTAMQ